MTPKTLDPERIKQSIDLRDLAERYTELRRETPREYSGPCPKCGGRDRFHVQADWFFCRKCHPKRGDAIEFVQWVGAANGFKAACELLSGGAMPEPMTRRKRPTEAPRMAQDGSWRARAKAYVAEAQERLHDGDNPGAEYLLGRGLDPITWHYWGWGYDPAAAVPGTKGQQRAPAIVLPWYRGGVLTGVRFRFLEPQGGHKMASLPGSRFSGYLYGGHVLPEFVRMDPDPGRPPAEAARTLILCEGELNAASIWQVTRLERVDVLSLGSESQRIPEGIVSIAQRYGRVITWLDRPEMAADAALALPGAHALSSPNGLDANDLLRRGQLGEYLAAVRLRLCKSDDERTALLWDLFDGGQAPHTVQRLAVEVTPCSFS